MSPKADKRTAAIARLREARDEWCAAAVTSAAQAKVANEEVQKMKEDDQEIGVYIDTLNDENATLRDEVKTLTQKVVETEMHIQELAGDSVEHKKGHQFFFDLLAVLGVCQDDVFHVLDYMGSGMSLREAFLHAMGNRLPTGFSKLTCLAKSAHKLNTMCGQEGRDT